MNLMFASLMFICLEQFSSATQSIHVGLNVTYKVQFLTKCLSGETIRRTVESDIKRCIIECKLRQYCKGAVYRRRLRICDLFASFEEGTESMNNGDCIFINKSDIGAAESPCGPCYNGKVCSFHTKQCKFEECGRKLLDDGVVLGNMFNVGDTVGFKCNLHYNDILGIKTATCQKSGTWTTYSNCTKNPMTCYDVKVCNSSFSDGEYWLYPSVLGGKKVKIYCFGLSTENPLEYITVKEENNYGFDAGGKRSPKIFTKYGKIRFDLTEGIIRRSDTTFSIPENSSVHYGIGRSCNCAGGCRPLRGYFNISLEGTGLKFSKEVNWIAVGWNARMSDFHRNIDSTVISAKCGGYCGHCKPSGSLYIDYNPNDVVEDESATYPRCN